MYIRDLIDGLEVIALSLGDDTEVRFASQPNWPFEYSIDDSVEPIVHNDIVYLAEGSQIGYLPAEVKDALGW